MKLFVMDRNDKSKIQYGTVRGLVSILPPSNEHVGTLRRPIPTRPKKKPQHLRLYDFMTSETHNFTRTNAADCRLASYTSTHDSTR